MVAKLVSQCASQDSCRQPGFRWRCGQRVRQLQGDQRSHDVAGVCRAHPHPEQRDTKDKLYALHAPEVECIPKGKARNPYEFGVKVSLAVSPTSAA